jgi:hypothetical protein
MQLLFASRRADVPQLLKLRGAKRHPRTAPFLLPHAQGQHGSNAASTLDTATLGSDPTPRCANKGNLPHFNVL